MMEKVKTAILLAAGKGTRLRPYTNETPKPLLPVKGKSFIERLVEDISSAGIENIIVVTGYMHEKFDYLKTKYENVQLCYNPLYESCNNISSFAAALPEVIGATLIMDADQLIIDKTLLRNEINRSGYVAYYSDDRKNEWGLNVYYNRIVSCNREFSEHQYVLQSMSYWTSSDIEKFSRLMSIEYILNHADKYWDDIALFLEKPNFKLCIFPTKEGKLLEIDTVEEYEAINEKT